MSGGLWACQAAHVRDLFALDTGDRSRLQNIGFNRNLQKPLLFLASLTLVILFCRRGDLAAYVADRQTSHRRPACLGAFACTNQPAFRAAGEKLSMPQRARRTRQCLSRIAARHDRPSRCVRGSSRRARAISQPARSPDLHRDLILP